MKAPLIPALGLFLFLATFLTGQDPPEPLAREDLHVYLLIGQSNMAGRAPLAPDHGEGVKGCLLLNEQNDWEPARHPLNQYSTIRKGLGMQKLNPGWSFVRAMRKANPKVTIGLVVNARGGSKIEEWTRGTRFYQDLLKRAKAAQESGTLKGVLWHQGESNSGQPGPYLAKLKDLVENLRNDLEEPNLPFVAGQIKEGEAINQEIARLPAALPNTGVASSKGLKTMDRWHFDAPSMITLGERYAVEMLKLLEK
jgi:hypothetical protein